MTMSFYAVLLATLTVWLLDQLLVKTKQIAGGEVQQPQWMTIVNYALAAAWFLVIWNMVRTGEANFELALIVATAVLLVVAAADRFVFERQRLSVAMVGHASGEDDMERHPWQPAVAENARSFLPVLLVVIGLRSFVAEPFTIPSGSMIPTLLVGDYIVVNKFAFGLRVPVTGQVLIPTGEPQRGDVLVFRYPENPRINYIKRVIGLPGDSLVYHNRQLVINGEPVPVKQVAERTVDGRFQELIFEETLGDMAHTMQRTFPLVWSAAWAQHEAQLSDWEVIVPEGHYFVMGDNRDNSRDSRVWGFVPEENVVGKATAKWMYKEPGLHWPRFERVGMIR